MILGLGIDLCPISRMARMLGRYGEHLERRLFTEGERAHAHARGNPAEHFAARFAAKEAALKALGVPSGLRWHELEIIASGRAPSLRFSGAAAAAAARLGVRNTHVSLSHAGDSALAVVVLEG
jgi:holo-[acyl-carrier protein] synthase